MKKKKLYLIPGFLTDKTIYKEFIADERFNCEVIEFIDTKHANEPIEEYAKRMAESINENENFGLLGTSFGGILSTEIAKHKTPEFIVFISSIKNRSEMNTLMKFEKGSLILDYIPSKVVKKTIETGYSIGSKLVSNLKEIDNEEINEMIHNINGRLEKWIIKKINNWKGENTIKNFLHLHGDKDHVFPIKNIKNCEVIKDGNHNMILVKSQEIRNRVAEFIGK